MFVQLTKEDCSYLLNLIETMDSDTAYTAKQRSYTVPKLKRISQDAKSARIAFQDVAYLIELIEDDDLPELEQQREMTLATIMEIQRLQDQKFEETKDIDVQREMRRARRNPLEALSTHFKGPSFPTV